MPPVWSSRNGRRRGRSSNIFYNFFLFHFFCSSLQRLCSPMQIVEVTLRGFDTSFTQYLSSLPDLKSFVILESKKLCSQYLANQLEKQPANKASKALQRKNSQLHKSQTRFSNCIHQGFHILSIKVFKFYPSMFSN